MEQVRIFYRSDFKVRIVSEMGFPIPFRLRFWTEKLSRSFEASWDGRDRWVNCHKENEKALCVGFDDHGLGLGKLMVEATYFADDECFRSGVCDNVVASVPVVCTDEQGAQYGVVLSREGDGGMELVYALPLLEAERKREVAEAERQVAEARRQKNELDRQESEQKRATAEAARATAEADREATTERAVEDAESAAREAREAIARTASVSDIIALFN